MLLHLHLKYMQELEGKAVGHRGKFDNDQWNQETELARKHAVEEEECVEAAKNWKIAAESSIKLMECMEKLASSSDTNIDEKWVR
jgi:hypothetical protein